MRRIHIALLTLFLILVHGQIVFAVPGIAPAAAKMAAIQQASHLLFTENRGQVINDKGQPRPDILFTAHSGTTQLFLTATGINYQFNKITCPEDHDKLHKDPREQAELSKETKKETYRFSLSLAGANPNAIIRKEAKNIYTENFYTSGCPDGITNVGTYERIVYENVYPQIDWVVYCNGNKLKYDFLVHRGGDPKQIKLKIDDAQSVQITEAGELLMKTTLGEVREDAPVSYAGDLLVKTAFTHNDDGSIGFDVEEYDGGELRIDPSVEWGMYYGGSSNDEFWSIATEQSGDIVCAGYTESPDYVASTNGYQIVNGTGGDALLVKFDSSGNRLWGTYYGGSSNDAGLSCTIDASSNVYMAGYTFSTGLATPGAFQIYLIGQENAMLVKFSATGARLWATYYGSGIEDAGYGCKTDAVGNVYLAGSTSAATGIATNGAYQTTYGGGGDDGFLVKFDSLGNRLWGTYYGGNGTDRAGGIVTDAASNVYISGFTTSSAGIATSNAYQVSLGGGIDAYLAKFDSSGARQWATYYGGSGNESIYENTLGIDRFGSIYLCGPTSSTSGIASSGAYQTVYGGGTDAFIVKFNADGIRKWGTYYGGSKVDNCFGTAFDSMGNIYAVGYTASDSGIATVDAYQNDIGGQTDGYMVEFDSTGIRKWATYFGGNESDGFYGCGSDIFGRIYAVGYIASNMYMPADSNSQTIYHGAEDGLLVKFSNQQSDIITGIISNSLCPGSTVNIPFITTDTFSNNNIFTAQLSDAAGYFSSTVNIGTLNGTTTGSITVIIPTNIPSGTSYRIRVVSSSPALIGTDNGSNLTINALLTPIITTAKKQLCATGYTTYQWYVNGVKLAGQVTPCITPLEDGEYTVAVTNGAGCEGTSLPYDLHKGYIIVTLYPNPASNVLYINASENVDVFIYTIDGRKVMAVDNATAIDLHKLPNAIYMVKVYDSYGRFIKSEKLVKVEE